jgi:hypothetical protein
LDNTKICSSDRLRKDLLDTGLFEFINGFELILSPGLKLDGVTRSHYPILRLSKTIFIIHLETLNWATLATPNASKFTYPIRIKPGPTSIEDIIDTVPDDISTEMLFHLNLFIPEI